MLNPAEKLLPMTVTGSAITSTPTTTTIMANVLPRMVAGLKSPYPTVHMLTQDHQNECRMELNGDCSYTVTQFGFFLYGYVQRNPALS